MPSVGRAALRRSAVPTFTALHSTEHSRSEAATVHRTSVAASPACCPPSDSQGPVLWGVATGRREDPSTGEGRDPGECCPSAQRGAQQTVAASPPGELTSQCPTKPPFRPTRAPREHCACSLIAVWSSGMTASVRSGGRFGPGCDSAWDGVASDNRRRPVASTIGAAAALTIGGGPVRSGKRKSVSTQ